MSCQENDRMSVVLRYLLSLPPLSVRSSAQVGLKRLPGLFYLSDVTLQSLSLRTASGPKCIP